MLRPPSMPLRSSYLVTLVALTALAPGCKKKPPPGPITRASASASVIASALAAPSASVAEPNDAAAPDAATNERAITAGTTPTGYHCGAFALKTLEESPGLAFGK